MGQENQSPWKVTLQNSLIAPIKQHVKASPHIAFLSDVAIAIFTPHNWVVCGWAGKMEDVYIRSQKHAIYLLKDGYKWSESEENLAALEYRLSDPNKKTELYIVHPDSPNMLAVAAMDIKKIGKPKSQSSDCKTTIQRMQRIRESILKKTGYDCAETNVFLGYDNAPPCVIIRGDKMVELDIYYPTAAPRALLDMLPGAGSLFSVKSGVGSRAWQYAESTTTAIKEMSKDDPKRNLWFFKLPANLEDLRIK